MGGSKARAVFSVQGAAAEKKIGRFGFFEGTYAAILNFISSKGLSPENIITINHNGTNYYIYYWKG